MLTENYKNQTDHIKMLVDDITEAISDDEWTLASVLCDTLRWRTEMLHDELKGEQE